MKQPKFSCAVTAALLCSIVIAADKPLKDAFKGRFYLGAAFPASVYDGSDAKSHDIVARHFSAITAENEMKPAKLQPVEGLFDFTTADKFVEFGEKNGMKIIGHCLVWHQQMPWWFFKDKDGNDVDRETLIARMRTHIHTVVGRYKGRVHGWDVVNEAFSKKGKLHASPWLRIIGSDFIELAFRFAHEADPDAELYYNDYCMDLEGKRQAVVRLIRDFRAKGVRIDGIGMQTHVSLTYPVLSDYEASIAAFAAEGVKVMATEMDVSVLPSAWDPTAEITALQEYDKAFDPWHDGNLPPEIDEELAQRYEDFFKLFLRYSDVIDRVTIWGVSDGASWLNYFPMRGRTDYPLLFDRDLNMKTCAKRIAQLDVAAQKPAVPEKRPCATFRHFEMTTAPVDGLAAGTEDPTMFANPIFPGMAPDPAITRKGGDYYLANSSFSYFPGIPVWHSTNLVDWDFCGYALRRPSQLAIKDGVDLSAGVFAPDIKYNPYNDTFYLIVTVIGDRGNVVLKSKDPRLGWSEPIKVPVGGIDPSFFFEDDKTAWILNNDDAPDGKAEYPGHRTVRMRKYDLVKDEVVPGTERIIINKGIRPEEKPIWCEGPHLYKIGSSYYVMTAEGGTAIWHSEVIWRSDKLEGPYTPCPVNPILTQRDIKNATITCAGHADIIQTPEGDWWAVFLGVQPYRKDGRDWCPTGRSTFLLPVEWIGEGDTRQPVILEKGKEIPLSLKAPALARQPQQQGADPVVDEFDTAAVDPMWFQIRTPSEVWYRSAVNGKPGLEIESRDATIYSKSNPSALLRWIKGSTFSASVVVDFKPTSPDSIAGLVLFQNEKCNYVLGLTADENGNPIIALDKSDKSGKTRIATAPSYSTNVMLKVDACNDIVRFYWSPASKAQFQIGGDEHATILTSDYAGGFVGTAIGLYASEKHE